MKNIRSERMLPFWSNSSRRFTPSSSSSRMKVVLQLSPSVVITAKAFMFPLFIRVNPKGVPFRSGDVLMVAVILVSCMALTASDAPDVLASGSSKACSCPFSLVRISLAGSPVGVTVNSPRPFMPVCVSSTMFPPTMILPFIWRPRPCPSVTSKATLLLRCMIICPPSG